MPIRPGTPLSGLLARRFSWLRDDNLFDTRSLDHSASLLWCNGTRVSAPFNYPLCIGTATTFYYSQIRYCARKLVFPIARYPQCSVESQTPYEPKFPPVPLQLGFGCSCCHIPQKLVDVNEGQEALKPFHEDFLVIITSISWHGHDCSGSFDEWHWMSAGMVPGQLCRGLLYVYCV